MPSRTPEAPILVEASDWTAVLRPDHGGVQFLHAVMLMARSGVQFEPHELEPHSFYDKADGTYRLASDAEPGAFVGWVLHR